MTIISGNSLANKTNKNKKLFLLVLFTILVVVLIFIFRKKILIRIMPTANLENNTTINTGSKINYPLESKKTATSTAENVKVLPLVIPEDSNQDDEERATQFATLKAKCPINTDAFKIDFSYKSDKFEVFVVKGEEERFWQWLEGNYSKLEKKFFIVTEL